jgi:Bifunctional DNA primase/polymerase, N-terminal
MTDFAATAARYAERSITVCRLTLDSYGRPKQRLDPYAPLRTGGDARWQPSDNTSLDWQAPEVKGIAIVLGPPSGNLAVIDIDDRGLGEYLWHWLSVLQVPPLMCLTPRGLHIYCREPKPSRWNHLRAKYQGRECDVDILAAGNVSAIPPTPGYHWLNKHALSVYGYVGAVWHDISLKAPLGIPYAEGRARLKSRTSSPSPTTRQIREALIDVS